MNLSKFSVLQASTIFTTRDYALQTKMPISSTTRSLKTLENKKVISSITRGLWAFTDRKEFHPFALVPYILGNEHGYISFLTVLHLSGILSQIPTRIQIATTGHSRILKTKVGVFEFFQVQPTMTTVGIEWSDTKLPFRIASPEKALLDTMYLSTRKGKRFKSLPELDLTKGNLQKKKFLSLVELQVKLQPIKSAILERFKELRKISITYHQ